jgi:Cu-processing system ATP-binding protein
MIRIEKIHKSYGRQEVLRNIHLHFTAGQSIALIGPNGSGKTSLIKIILGMVLPTKGKVWVDGEDITAGPSYRRMIGYMPQISRFPEQMRVAQLFTMIRQMRPDVKTENYDTDLYRDFDIERMAGKPLGNLSGGMRQQVSAALAFWFNPAIIILDEPTAALDPVSNEILKSKVNEARESGKLILTTSHILNDLEEISQHIVYLMEGEVIFDASLDTLKARTSETKLGRMVVAMLKQHQYNG